MKEKYLVINAGSSSLKFSLYEENGEESKELVNGIVERIGEKIGSCTLKFGKTKQEQNIYVSNHTFAVELMLNELLKNKIIENIDEIKGVGHRVLHGGEFYNDSVIVDDEVLNNIKSLEKFGPLHVPGQVSGIESMMSVLSNIPQVAVFDTAFHQSIPKHNYLYAVPYEWYEKNGVRRYGFHGTSHKYITEYMQKVFNKKEVNLIICHIGSGASICEVKNGKSYNTTMGLTPLDGLIMGTRSGIIDPSIIEFITKEQNISVEKVTEILNKKSGLLGICGVNDFRDVLKFVEEGNEKAIVAYNMFKESIKKYIVQYYAELNGDVDGIIFTAGIGENVSVLREDIINDLSKPLGLELNKEENNKIAKFLEKTTGKITTDNSKIPFYVIPTNEEYMIKKDTKTLCQEYRNTKRKVLK